MWLRSAFHVWNGSPPNNPADKFYKLRDAIDTFNVTCRGLYSPGAKVTIDESMVKTESRYSPGKVRIANKSVKIGQKCFVVASPDGIVLSIAPSTGLGTVEKKYLCEDETKNLSNVSLINGLLGQAGTDSVRVVFLDRWFTSLRVAESLAGKNIGVIGTMRTKTTDTPVPLDKKRFAPGEVRQYLGRHISTGSEVLLTEWRDRSLVTTLASLSGTSALLARF